MKAPTTLLLAASLLANGVLLAVIATRSGASRPPPAHDAPAAGVSSASDAANTNRALLAALASGDRRALEAAGASADIARDLTLGRTFARYANAARGRRSGDTADGRWWRSSPGARAAMSREERQQFWAAQRELADGIVAAFGDDLGLFGAASSNARLAFLPPGKRDALRRIEQDYTEMMAEYAGTGGVQLASDREQLKLLRAERERDLAALLSPAERADYDLRSSPTAAAVQIRYGDAISSEEDFRKIYDLQKAFDEKFPREAFTGRITPEMMQQRSAAERQLQDDLRTALGDEKYAALRRAADSDLRLVDSLASRLSLPPTTTDAVAAARDSYAAQSQRISADTSLPPPQRRSEIEKLAARAKTDLTQALGSEGADAYAQRSAWLNMLQGGMAFSTNPKDAPPGSLAVGGGQIVFPILPAGAGGAGTRQVINFVGGTSTAPGAGPTFTLPAPGRTQSETQTYSIIRTEGPAAAPAPTNPAPPPANTAPAPKP